MANFFKDNSDLVFTLNNLDLAEVAALREDNYKLAQQFDNAPTSFEDALDNYNRVLEIVGEICGDRIEPRSRIVDMPMRTVYFKPSGKLPASAERVSLKFEELEALRLADLEGLSQSEASSGMGVSRHTFGRVLASARKKVALSLVNNIPLVVTGGTNSCRRESGELLKEHPAMKIAISAEGPTLEDDVDPRFGRAAGFIIYDTETKAVEYIENGAGQTAAQGAGLIAVETVSNAGATVALSGYIGPKAFDALQAIGIGTVQDVDNRTVGEVVRAFEAGELTVILPSNKEA